jgi:hypothetical protein
MDNLIFAINILQINSHIHQCSSANIANQFISNTNVIEKRNDPVHEEAHALQAQQSKVLPLDGTNCIYEKDENGIIIRNRNRTFID